jgi:serine protease SohB
MRILYSNSLKNQGDPMMAFLAEYGLFLAKTLTILLSFIFALALIFSVASKHKRDDEELEIIPLNEKFKSLKTELSKVLLSKAAYKKLRKAQKKEKKPDIDHRPALYVIRFEGDIRATEVKQLREVISAILTQATPKDEVLALIESPGGMVHSYGLAASQLDRIKRQNIPLTIAVDKIAASGGYMMACVANTLLAAPFAIIGSIGVIGQLPNFNKLLEKHHIDVEQHTAGEFKRTLTMFGKNTEQGRKKFQEELEQTQHLFKGFIKSHRPQVDIDAVATGEHWYGTDALNLQLVDQIITSDEYLQNKLNTHRLFEVKYHTKQPLSEKFAHFLTAVKSAFM